MSARTRVGLCIVVQAVGLAFSGLGVAGAEPSAGCRDLAARFANAAAQLDTRSLADLLTCVSAEIQNRTPGPAPAPPTGSLEATQPAPAPAQPTPPPRVSEWGAWPAPAPWGGNWPPAAPWDR